MDEWMVGVLVVGLQDVANWDMWLVKLFLSFHRKRKRKKQVMYGQSCRREADGYINGGA